MLVPALPLAGFLALAIGRALPRRAVAAIGVGSVGLSMIAALAVGGDFILSPPAGRAYTVSAWQWMNVAGFAPRIAFYVDALAVVMMAAVTVVGFLIHLYSAAFMAEDEGYGRFFAYMNLFVGSMLVLVLADNLLVLYLGWEGVGLCSYLLIGFWYKDRANGLAAIKAFVVTRIGDAALLVGLIVIFASLGTLEIQEAARRATAAWPIGSGIAVAAAALILGGAVGKSAQLPLQTWLPDAMAGPTPVSALIHAATMVTAGVYLIARTHAIFELAPFVQGIVAVIGAVTLLLAGFSATTQRDVKRVLAYSTISQIGYMFLALGIGAWTAAIFHFLTHAFFKSLLFLAAGVVIMGLNREHDMFKMGGLRKALPFTFWVFLVGSMSMSAIPPIFSGFYSKDWILDAAWAAGGGGRILWACGLAGVFLTSLYTFRMLFLVFFGQMRQRPTIRTGLVMGIPLLALSAGAAVVGLLETPGSLGGVRLFSEFTRQTFPKAAPLAAGGMEVPLLLFSQAASVVGLAVAYLLTLPAGGYAGDLADTRAGAAFHRLWFGGWGFDRLYGALFVRPLVVAARANKGDFIDLFYRAIAWLSKAASAALSGTQNGLARWYAAGVAFGAIVILIIVVLS